MIVKGQTTQFLIDTCPAHQRSGLSWVHMAAVCRLSEHWQVNLGAFTAQHHDA